MCSRNAFGIVRPGLQITELTLDDYKKIFFPAFLDQLTFISMCGVYGDPILAKDLLEIIKYTLRNNPHLRIDIYTNGSVHSASWWKKLAQVMRNGKVVFGIDGLEDTHHIHRRGTKFAIVLKNAKAFINAGGRAQWDFIVFKHNEHQVEQARKLSTGLGFKIFQVKRTSRFYKALYEKDPMLESTVEEFGKYPLYNSKGRKYGCIELPENPYYRNASLKTIKSLTKEFGSLIRYFDKVPIDCQAKQTKGIFVSAEGLVYPCCWLYQQTNYGAVYGVTDPLELNEWNILRDVGGIRQISAKERPLKNIVEGKFFKQIEKSWNILGIANGRPKVCARACGNQLDMHKEQHEKRPNGEIY
jgi:MoaA/NifB/PqqE/SkfB family radical SAM enzyme